MHTITQGENNRRRLHKFHELCCHLTKIHEVKENNEMSEKEAQLNNKIKLLESEITSKKKK